jgi:hypothetical protein
MKRGEEKKVERGLKRGRGDEGGKEIDDKGRGTRKAIERRRREMDKV